MGKIYDSILDTIGRTPLVRTPRFAQGIEADLTFKLESFNPMASVKDRIGSSMVLDALERGVIKKETTVIEPTSGNTGIALAFAPPRGFRSSSRCRRRCRSSEGRSCMRSVRRSS